MPNKKCLIVLLSILAIISGTPTASVPAWAASREQVLHRFNDLRGGIYPAGVILDAAGNLYGATTSGGAYGDGAIFKLAPAANGKWTETVLHSFHGKDGSTPVAGVIFDAAGNLYGTTAEGGSSANCGSGCGVVFELMPRADGKWTETLLHSFNFKDGLSPIANLIFDVAGNLYGTTAYGGDLGDGCGDGCGVVFELMRDGSGKWTEKVLHSFAGKHAADGFNPEAALAVDAAGNLYGTTVGGGNQACQQGCGTVFELMPSGDGKWTETVLHSFCSASDCTDGGNPFAGVILDWAGNLYGTTALGGAYGGGTVFRLAPGANGKWTETVLHSFNPQGGEGLPYYGGLTFDASGNLYGTTSSGDTSSCYSDCGTAFKLSHDANDHWAETVLRRFSGEDGAWPMGSLVPDTAGNWYGATWSGGSVCGCGVVFQISP